MSTHHNAAAESQHDLDGANTQSIHSKVDPTRSNLDMPERNKSAWNELFFVGGKIPNRRAYHVSFVWQNE